MGKRKGGYRKKTRAKLKKHYSKAGKISIRDYVQEFRVNETVVLKPEAGIHKGMPHQRYFGMHGIIEGKQGRCYKVNIKNGNRKKLLVIHPVHLKALRIGSEDMKKMVLMGV
ncbi:50S ribosomal protein L21e [archaeon]|nr:50S ribosomal protein L21e [archaeon]